MLSIVLECHGWFDPMFGDISQEVCANKPFISKSSIWIVSWKMTLRSDMSEVNYVCSVGNILAGQKCYSGYMSEAILLKNVNGH